MIDANLKRVFGAEPCQDMPDRFADLLAQLEQVDRQCGDGDDTAGSGTDPDGTADDA